ncbi:hypothetical protein [Nostoc linckia]|uniref:hypothetical protein n=1 Tax=Nostoc linckia TaxID=92942 RepID=UPI0015D508D2|nr:hypothetical protein [Nostoc linckia]
MQQQSVEFEGVRSPPLLLFVMGSWSALELGKKLVTRKIQKLLLGFVLKVRSLRKT